MRGVGEKGEGGGVVCVLGKRGEGRAGRGEYLREEGRVREEGREYNCMSSREQRHRADEAHAVSDLGGVEDEGGHGHAEQQVQWEQAFEPRQVEK